jgi:predicted small lipoprotein YifL
MRKLLFVAITAALLTACGGGGGPLGLFGPPAAKDIAAKPGQSSERDGHFTVTGTLANGSSRFPTTGDGVMVLKPKLALQLNLQVDSGTFLGRIGADFIDVDGKQYSRIGAEDWNISDDPATSNGSKTYSYVGEEQVGSDKAWHIKSSETGWDEWVRESDSYLAKLSIAESGGGSLTLTFDRFNTGAKVQAP